MLIEYAKDLALAGWELEVIEEYGGRGMFVATTAAVRSPDIGSLIAAACDAVQARLVDNDPVGPFIKAMSSLSIDALGHDIVAY